MAVLGGAEVAVLRYRARISFDDGPGFTCWHTDCYRVRGQDLAGRLVPGHEIAFATVTV